MLTPIARRPIPLLCLILAAGLFLAACATPRQTPLPVSILQNMPTFWGLCACRKRLFARTR